MDVAVVQRKRLALNAGLNKHWRRIRRRNVDVVAFSGNGACNTLRGYFGASPLQSPGGSCQHGAWAATV